MLPELLPGTANSRQHRSQRNLQHVGRFLVCQFAHHNQQQGLSQFVRQPPQGLLHLVRIAIVGQSVSVDGRFVVGQQRSGGPPRPSAPAVSHASSQNGRQPRPVTASRLITPAALPHRAERLLNDVFRFVPVANQTIREPVHGRSVLRHQAVEFGKRERHGQQASGRDVFPFGSRVDTHSIRSTTSRLFPGELRGRSRLPDGAISDYFVVLCRTREEADAALAMIWAWMAENGLTLHPEKTHIVDVRRLHPSSPAGSASETAVMEPLHVPSDGRTPALRHMGSSA